VRLRNNIFDIAFNIICLIQLVGITVYLVAVWNSLPDQIPGHFNFAGEVTRWDDKSSLLVMPILAWVLFGGILLVEQFPHIWNTSVTVTEENKFRVYRVLKSLIGVVKLVMVTFFVFIAVYQTLAIDLPGWLMPVYLVLVFAPIIYFTIQLRRMR